MLPISAPVEFGMRAIWEMIVSFEYADLFHALFAHFRLLQASWLDHSRDLLHIVNVFRDQMPQPIVGIGHSLGAGQL